MKIEIKERKENKLLGRLEVEGRAVFDGATPSNDVIKDMLTAELKADKNLIVVKHIYSRFSYQEADFLVYVYDNKEVMEKMEMMTKHLKKKGEEEKKKAAEEKPKEEEKKEEEKVEETREEQSSSVPQKPEVSVEPAEEAPKEEKKEESKEEGK